MLCVCVCGGGRTHKSRANKTFDRALKSREDIGQKEYKWWLFMLIWRVQSEVLICMVLASHELFLSLWRLFAVIFLDIINMVTKMCL